MQDKFGKFIRGSKQGFQKGNKWGFHKGYIPWNKGKTMPKWIGEKISIASKGRKHSEETKKKISLSRMGKNNPAWKGGRKKTIQGYVHILTPSHPYSPKSGYVPQHRLVMEKKIKRYLNPIEVVHHINGKKDDNRIKNLLLFKNDSAHHGHHYKLNHHYKR